MLTEKDGKLYGRGATDDKGPVLGWLHAIEAFQQTGNDMPVNLKVRKSVFITCAVNVRHDKPFVYFVSSVLL